MDPDRRHAIGRSCSGKASPPMPILEFCRSRLDRLLIKHTGMNIGAVDRGMASGTPTGALPQKGGMQGIANIDLATAGVLHLCMAFQAKIGVRLDQQLAIEGAVRVVANGAAFSERFVFKYEGASLFAVTFGAVLI